MGKTYCFYNEITDSAGLELGKLTENSFEWGKPTVFIMRSPTVLVLNWENLLKTVLNGENLLFL